jgi:hypothetical protein
MMSLILNNNAKREYSLAFLLQIKLPAQINVQAVFHIQWR